MKYVKHWRAAAIAVPAAFVVAVAVAACRDALLPRQTSTSDALVTRPSTLGAMTQAPSAKARNPYHWVGVAHNRAMDDFRREIRKPGALTRSLCAYLVDYAAAPARIPEQERSADPGPSRQAAVAGLSSSRLCRNRSLGALPAVNASAGAVSQEVTLTPAAEQLVSEVLGALDAASGTGDLAARLSTVGDAASTLSETEHAVIAIGIDVAQHSYEYWEQNLGSFTAEISSEYADCTASLRAIGTPSGEALDTCMNGGVAQSEWLPPVRYHGVEVRLAGGVRGGCETLGYAWRKAAKADFVGAVGGALRGLWAGLAGAGTGALAGAGAGSLGAAIDSAIEMFICAL